MLSTLLGASYSERMTRDTTHLICSAKEGNKYNKALQWGIPVVTIEWLYESAVRGKAIPPTQWSAATAASTKKDAVYNKENKGSKENVKTPLTTAAIATKPPTDTTRADCGTSARKVNPHDASLYGQKETRNFPSFVT